MFVCSRVEVIMDLLKIQKALFSFFSPNYAEEIMKSGKFCLLFLHLVLKILQAIVGLIKIP